MAAVSKNPDMIWKRQYSPEALQAFAKGSMLEHLDIKMVEIGNDYLIARMPVDHRTHQPLGLLHGGASAALAESMGSFASMLMIEDPEKKMPVGVTINASHLNPVRDGFVYARAEPVKTGRTIHVWRIDITDDRGRLVCTSQLTVMIVDRR